MSESFGNVGFKGVLKTKVIRHRFNTWWYKTYAFFRDPILQLFRRKG